MKSNFDILQANSVNKGGKSDWSFNAKRERTNTTPARTFHPTEVVPEYAMPIGHDTRKSFVMARSFAPLKRERK